MLDSSFPGWDDGARRVWSLWEIMNQFSLSAVIGNLQLLMMSAMTGMATSVEYSEITDTDLSQVASLLGTARSVIKFAGLNDSCDKIERTIEWLGSSRNVLTKQSLGAELRNICEAISMEAQKKKFLYIEADRSEYIGGHLFGVDVFTAFPSAANDISSAGNCLAVECHTAAIFHLMRAVEWGMRSLCADLGLTKTKRKRRSGRYVYVPIEYSEWEKLLDQLQDRVDAKLSRLKRGVQKQKLQEFYYPALQDLRGFRDAWRNHVMHSRAEYTREDALAVFSHVKRFMLNLSSRIAEV
jgi:hypothetical protein